MGSSAIPVEQESGSQFLAYLQQLHRTYSSLQEGVVASYIPEIARADPDWFAICAVTVDGRLFQVGDDEQLFTIQSISKPFVYGLALEDHGRDYVLTRVGVEPTGDPFNSIIKLDESSKRPLNPMVNAGAIATASLIKGSDPTERLNRMLAMFRRYVGHDVFVDMSVFVSERTTGHRNRAMAYLMLNFGMIDAHVEQVLDLYFQQCSVMVNCRDLALMAATLANNGVNPHTKERALEEHYVRDLLSVMYTCGMYDYSGEWAYNVGLPAKSGITGGIIAVVPGVMGIAVFSPRLQSQGNSLRGIRVCQDLSEHFGLHVFSMDTAGSALLKRLLQVPSAGNSLPGSTSE
ncbi:glutaminase A [Gloeobacter kilaueensis]|uniref:Glutaminase n=1 Tax=Gloeobacter kilaueensis (strain ATCC BAA-2537 / CCAP 1431/1 / ULC 316 / JS1) TaxID=1183438 RepID=U5QGX3_GLOK1|nr:glutaminase A [Gloeobacter kilaueensis]AGY58143.1 glutaminase [Gloeobacter kilaueensis JS1]